MWDDFGSIYWGREACHLNERLLRSFLYGGLTPVLKRQAFENIEALNVKRKTEQLSGGSPFLAGSQVIEIIDQARLHLFARNDCVNEAVIEQKFGGLKARRQF